MLSEILGDSSNIISIVCDLTEGHVALRDRIAMAIIEENSIQCLELLKMYADSSRIASWEKRAIEQGKLSPGRKPRIESDESVQMIDLLLDEVASLNQICGRYDLFLSDFGDNVLKANAEFKSKVLLLS